jgi:Mobilization protein NikA
MPKRAGRPAVAASQRREVIFRFVTTKAEASKLRGKAKERGMTISEYLRSVAIPKE